MTILSGVKNFFNRKSQSFGVVVMRYLNRNGIRATENYERLVKESYGLNSVVYACVKEIASAASGIEFVLKKKVGDREEVIDNHPILDLLKNLNPLEGGTEFIEKLVSYYQLSGSTFMESAGPLFGRGKTRELYILRPDQMTIIPDRVTLIGGYEYKVGNEKVKYDTGQVRHLKMFNPLDDFKGMSPVQVAALAIDKMNQVTGGTPP